MTFDFLEVEFFGQHVIHFYNVNMNYTIYEL